MSQQTMKRKILIIDDSKFNIKIVEDILLAEDYQVHSLTSGLHVEETVHTYQPDAILLDIIMPDIDGFSVCSTLKANDETKHIPIIMITSMTEASHLRRAFELGAFDYIKKPFDTIEVVARLQSALRFYDQQRELEELATKDGLTGLYNHRLSMEFLEKECGKSQREGSSISFLMLDIDYFKSINDTYGHKIGDLVLRELGALLLSIVLPSDIVGRYGGEEFCVVLSNHSLEDTVELAEQIRSQVEHFAFSISQPTPLHITMSVGVAFAMNASGISCNDIIITADAALYQAKHSGRNRVLHKCFDLT